MKDQSWLTLLEVPHAVYVSAATYAHMITPQNWTQAPNATTQNHCVNTLTQKIIAMLRAPVVSVLSPDGSLTSSDCSLSGSLCIREPKAVTRATASMHAVTGIISPTGFRVAISD